MAKSELSNGNNNRNEKEVDVPTFRCLPNAQAVCTHVRNSWLCTTNPSSDQEAGGYLVDVLSLHTGREEIPLGAVCTQTFNARLIRLCRKCIV